MKFEDCKISTSTFIGTSNLVINLVKVFETIPLVHHDFDTNPSLNQDGVVSVKYNQQTRGLFPNDKNKHSKSFRNTLTLIVCVSCRTFNFKIFSGSIGNPNKTQHPGAKSIHDAIQSFKVFWNCIVPFRDLYVVKQDPTITLYSVMTNINFNIGMNINRQRLYKVVKGSDVFKTFIDIDHGHTGVNIKLEIDDRYELDDIPIMNLHTDEISYTTTQEYYKLLSPTQVLKDKKQKMSTFIVFHSGKVIMSSCNIKYMRIHFDVFMRFINSNKNEIEDTSTF